MEQIDVRHSGGGEQQGIEKEKVPIQWSWQIEYKTWNHVERRLGNWTEKRYGVGQTTAKLEAPPNETEGSNHVDGNIFGLGMMESPARDCILHHSRMTVTTLDGNFERPRGSVLIIHNALKYPDNALLPLSDLKDVGGGDHEC